MTCYNLVDFDEGSVKKILLVDDEVEFTRVLEMSLRKAGYDVEQVPNGLEGLERARSGRPDLIVLDLRLPTLDGHTVCQMLKADQAYRHIPIIMLTASREQEDQEWAARTGADLYMTKPCRLQELKDAISRLLTAAA